jgi:hypothetical protein
MNARAITLEDMKKLREIHARFFANEFSFPDFTTGFLCAFVVTDDSQEIIAAGGIRPIAESILITNKDFLIKERRSALLEVMNISEFVCKKSGYDQLHAFIQDENWLRHLTDVGFRPTKGQSLVIDL